MADIKVLYVDNEGYNQEHNSATDSIKLLSLKTANYELTDTHLGNLIGGSSTDGSAEHNHDSLYFRKTEFINVSTGATDAGKPLKTDSFGQIDNSFIHVSTLNALLSHSALQNLSADDHLQYIRVDGTRAFTGIQAYNSHPSFISDLQIPDKKYVDDLFNGREYQDSVLTRTITPPGSPSTGARFLIDGTLGTPTGVFVGHTNAIATWNGTAYVYTVPTIGMVVDADDDTTGIFLYSGSAWVKKFYESTTGSTGIVKVGMDIQLNPTVSGNGLNFTGGVIDVNVDNSSIEISADTLRVKALGIKAPMIDFGLGGTQVKAGLIPIVDVGNFYPVDDLESALQFIGKEVLELGVEYTVGAGGVTKGDLLFVSGNDIASKYISLTTGSHCIGLANATLSAGAIVSAVANDTVLKSVLTGATAGTPYYWNGTGYTTTMPTTSLQNVWEVGVAKNATDLTVGIRQVKKNA